jgi:Protein of unknown function (DUF2442)
MKGVSLSMYWDVVEVKPEQVYRLFVQFKDGLSGLVRLAEEELTGTLAPLRDEHFFKQVFIDHGAVTWPGDVDLAPDAMHADLKAQRQAALNSHDLLDYVLGNLQREREEIENKITHVRSELGKVGKSKAAGTAKAGMLKSTSPLRVAANKPQERLGKQPVDELSRRPGPESTASALHGR